MSWEGPQEGVREGWQSGQRPTPYFNAPLTSRGQPIISPSFSPLIPKGVIQTSVETQGVFSLQQSQQCHACPIGLVLGTHPHHSFLGEDTITVSLNESVLRNCVQETEACTNLFDPSFLPFIVCLLAEAKSLFKQSYVYKGSDRMEAARQSGVLSSHWLP